MLCRINSQWTGWLRNGRIQTCANHCPEFRIFRRMARRLGFGAGEKPWSEAMDAEGVQRTGSRRQIGKTGPRFGLSLRSRRHRQRPGSGTSPQIPGSGPKRCGRFLAWRPNRYGLLSIHGFNLPILKTGTRSGRRFRHVSLQARISGSNGERSEMKVPADGSPAMGDPCSTLQVQ